MTTIAHITDLHVDGTPERRARVVGALEQAWDRADYLVVTGDCTAWGHPNDFRELGELLAPWPSGRATIVGGNHDLRDDRRPWPDAMLGTALEKHYTNSRPGVAVDLGDAVVVAVSTQFPRRALAFRALGKIPERELRRVDTLASRGRKPVVVAMHHGPQWHALQPFDGLTNRAAVLGLLERRPTVHVLCGHDHRALDVGPVHAAPAVADSHNPLRLYEASFGGVVPLF